MSDRSLFEPNDEHEQAALVDNDEPFAPPVSGLLEIGEPRRDDEDDRIAALGLSQEDVPAIVRLMLDRRLNEPGQDDEAPEPWGPVNALFALKQFDVSAHTPELVRAFDLDADWIREELPAILGKAGAAAIEPLRAYLSDQTRWVFGRSAAASALVRAAHQHPDLRDQVVSTLSEALEQFATNDPELNGFLVTDLAAELHAAEALPLIRRAFEADRVEETIMGDWLDVLEELGQEPDPDDPLVALSNQRRRVAPQRRMLTPPSGPSAAPRPQRPASGKSDVARKRKNKRKAEAASRKANKKRKK